MREITVASVQMECRNFDVGGNWRRAGRFVEQAAQVGAELVLLPEFVPRGYLYDEAAWQAAEPAGGTIDTWLIENARRHQLLIGTSYLEARGEHFYNRFSLAGPDGIRGSKGGHRCRTGGWSRSPGERDEATCSTRVAPRRPQDANGVDVTLSDGE